MILTSRFKSLTFNTYTYAAFQLCLLYLLCLSYFIYLLLVPSFVSANNSVVELPTGITQHSTVEGITEYRLDNGLTVLLLPDNSQTLVTVNMTYRVGSKHENYGETGMAHLLEHLLFKGTPSIPDLSEAMNRRGFKMNGTTYFDRTNYYQTFHANPAHLAWAIQMEADRMVNSFIAKKDLDSEMNVVWDELRRGENSPARVLGQRMMSVAFDWHNYGKSTIGTPSDLNNVPIEALKTFYKHYYQPDNAVLSIAGRIQTKDTLALIAQAFKDIPKPTRLLTQRHTTEPTQEGERRIVLRRTGDTPIVSVQYHLPAASHSDSAALSIWSHILGNEPAGRLYKTLNKPQLAANTYAWINPLAERSIFIIGAQLEGKQAIEKAEAALIKATEHTEKLTDLELNRAQIDIESSFKQLLKSPETIAITLSESIGQGDWRLLFLKREAIKRATLAEVSRVVKSYLKADNRTVGHFIPTQIIERASIPPAPDIKKLIENTPFSPSIQLGENIDTSPSALEKRTKRSYLNIESSHPIPFITLNKNNRAEANTLKIILRWGNETTLNNNSVKAATWVAPLLLEGNEKIGLSKQQLTDSLAKLESTLDIDSYPTGATITITSNRNHLIEVINLLNKLVKPRQQIKISFDTKALELLKSNQLAQLNAQLKDPRTQINDAVATRNNIDQQLKPNDWRYRLNTKQMIEHTNNLKINDIERFYHQFWTTQYASVSAVGTLPDKLPVALSTLLKDWPVSEMASKQKYTRQHNDYFDNKPFQATLQINDKANAVIHTHTNFKLKRSHIDYWPLQIGVHILGGDPFTSRIGKRVRVKEGLSYSAGSNAVVDTYDDYATYNAYASFAPNNLSKVQIALNEEFSKLLEKGITAQELSDTQSYLLQNLEQQRNSDEYLASHLLYQSELGIDFSIHDEHRKRIQSADINAVNTALKHYLNSYSLNKIEIAAGDFKVGTK